MSLLMKPNDAAWLLIDKPEQPCHIACLSIFTPPPDAPRGYLRSLVEQFRNTRVFAPPFNYVRRRGLSGALLPAWEEVPAEDIDLDYHFRHSALPEPGSERELGVLISRLHSHRLDFRRPLWELHLIEGLEGGRFALYLKLHHSQFDGMAGVALWRRVLSSDPGVRHCQPPWAVGMKAAKRAPATDRPKASGPAASAVLPALSTVGEVLRSAATGEIAAQRALPFAAPKTILNGRIHRQRRIATQHYPLERIKAVASRAGVSINDVFMAICGGGLRRYLAELGKLPADSLIAGMPVSVRPAGDDSGGNSITFIHGKLGTDLADPAERLRACQASAQLAKQQLQQMPKEALANYTLMLMAPYLGQVALGLGGYGRPMHNLIISNVPGEREAQYFNGARLQQCYPISLLFNGQALNVSVFSCGGGFNLGFIGCRDTLPSMQKLAVYTGEALAELEGAVR